MSSSGTRPNRNYQNLLNRALPVFKALGFGDLINDMITSHNSSMLTKAGLAIHGAASPLAKAATAFIASVGGVLVRKAANTDMAALVGTFATANSGAWAFYTDNAGNLTSSAMASAATHAAAVAALPVTPAGVTLIGFVVLDNTSGSNFVGNTTNLDAAGIAATYYDCMGPSPFVVSLANRG